MRERAWEERGAAAAVARRCTAEVHGWHALGSCGLALGDRKCTLLRSERVHFLCWGRRFGSSVHFLCWVPVPRITTRVAGQTTMDVKCGAKCEI